jgi:hypothetical protein
MREIGKGQNKNKNKEKKSEIGKIGEIAKLRRIEQKQDSIKKKKSIFVMIVGAICNKNEKHT